MKTFKTFVLIASLAALGACSSAHKDKPQAESSRTVSVQEGVPGGTVVDTYQSTAKIVGIGRVNREVTLGHKDGSKTTFIAGPEVRNFDQLQVGDKVKATLVQELVVSLNKSGTPNSQGKATAVAVAPKGAKPGVVMVNTVQVTAKVTKLDLQKHHATLRFSDGKSKTYPVRPDVDLTKVKLGDEVVIRKSEAMALLVEKP